MGNGHLGLLAFDLSSAPDRARITSAALCLTPMRSTRERITVDLSSDRWDNDVTYRTRPHVERKRIGVSSAAGLRTGRRSCIPLKTARLVDRPVVSFRLASSGAAVRVRSLESGRRSPSLKLRFGPAGSSTAAPSATGSSTLKPTDFLTRHSAYTLDVAAAPQHRDSARLVRNLASQVESHWGGIAAFNVFQYNATFYTASERTQRRKVVWDNCQNKSYVPSQLYSAAGGAVFADVPVPRKAVPASGADAELTIYDPKTDQLWELWKARHLPDGWHACWGGRIDAFSTSAGYFPNGTGATATGLSIAASSIGIKEMRSGVIKHAMYLTVINAAHWSTYSYPAQRSDGNLPAGTPHAIPEGMRFRLDPTVDVSTLGLTRIGRAVAVAAQKYGFIVADKGGAVALSAESGNGVLAATGTNPWDKLMQGLPSYRIMSNFPWNRLQALPMDYGKP